ncbi:MAG: hypothetical protein IVW56_10975 [Candidatus Binataceae bacterium]|nr:hypothetical protein [Candidatus Binataceae bacterium]
MRGDSRKIHFGSSLDDASFRWGYEIWSFVEFVIPMGVDMADGAAWGHDQMIAAHLEPLPPPRPRRLRAA